MRQHRTYQYDVIISFAMLFNPSPAPRARVFTGDVSQKQALTSFCCSISNGLLTWQTHLDAIIISINSMNMRAAAATARCAAEYNALLSALAQVRTRVLRDSRARSRAYDKCLDDKSEEADAVSKQLAAVSAMCASHSMHASALLHSVRHMSTLAQSLDCDGASLFVPVSTLAPLALATMSTVWRELPDGVVSTVSGGGMRSFVKGASGATRNVVLVYPRIPSGPLAEYVKPSDVRLMLRDDAGSLIDALVSVEHVTDGPFQLAYVVSTDWMRRVSVRVSVCKVAVGSAVIIRSEYDANNGTNPVASYDVGRASTSGMAVNAAGSMLAVSVGFTLQQVHVFRLTPTFERVCVIGRWGSGPAEFRLPRRLCFTDDDTIIVCDNTNNRVQQLTVAGEYLSSFIVGMPVSVAVHGDLVAVGTLDGHMKIHLHSLATGTLIRKFGSRGLGPGQIHCYASGIRFTPDGAGLLVAEHGNVQLSLFTSRGVFQKQICAGLLDNGPQDVSFGAGGEILVADSCNPRICVFSPAGDTLITTWGAYGTAAGEFLCPKGLAVSGSYFYVMDNTRVQVFE